ncbi:hypothetical protein [Clostridium botulinum]|uniref:hypothetical protein n=1 Tax=Clostridium botulinum TaxID=1491 RepID=UPI003DA3D768
MFENLKDFIKQNLQSKVEAAGLNKYEIFGKEVEDPISDLIEEYLNYNNISYIAKRAENKNEFPDLKLIIDGKKYAFEHKAGEVKNNANDLGTLNAYPEKIEKYGDNIYCVYIKYSKATQNNSIIINDVYFDKIYRFIGKTAKAHGILKYRKKDGNLRPKSWGDFTNNTVYFNTLAEFESAIPKTVKYRAEKLVLQHIESLDQDSLKDILNYINEKIESK